MNARLAEGAPEQGELHLAGVDGRHGRVAEASDAQRGLQLHLGAGLGPQPAAGGRAGGSLRAAPNQRLGSV